MPKTSTTSAIIHHRLLVDGDGGGGDAACVWKLYRRPYHHRWQRQRSLYAFADAIAADGGVVAVVSVVDGAGYDGVLVDYVVAIDDQLY